MEEGLATGIPGWNKCELIFRKIGDGIINHYNANTISIEFLKEYGAKCELKKNDVISGGILSN